MKHRRTMGMVAGAVMAVAVGFGAVVTGVVAPASATLAGGERQAQAEGEGGFYSLEYTLKRWQELGPEINAKYPLPDGREFPESTVMLEVPKDGEVYRFQEGMAEQLIAQYWHCAWIDSAVGLSVAGDSTGAAVAAEKSLKWVDLPSVSTQSANRSSVAASTLSANGARKTGQPWWVDEKNMICGSLAEVSK